MAPPALRDAPFLEGEVLARYRIFLDVARNRSVGMAGPMALTSGNLLDYFKVNQIPPAEWPEIEDFVTRYDDLWLTEHFKAVEANKPTK